MKKNCSHSPTRPSHDPQVVAAETLAAQDVPHRNSPRQDCDSSRLKAQRCLIDPSRGDGGTIFVQSANVPQPPRDPNATAPTRGTPAYDKSAPKVTPQLVLAIEHYNRLVRMLQAGET